MRMKQHLILLTIVMVFSISFFGFYSPAGEPYARGMGYEEIWKEGYVDGWCYDVRGHCIEPIPPIPPLPRVQDTTRKIIYNRGFIAGRKANK